jgi:hypothetical protein
MKKTNFIKEWPKEYVFMTKYPPLMRDSQEQVESKTMRVPYLRLYHDAVRKNPSFEAERVYPAYWQQEPLAMVLAKKQYALMQAGLDEDAAYLKAKQSVDGMEHTAYDALNILRETLGDESARPALLADEEVASEVAKWQQVLATTPYEELEDADQGEVDYFIQTKILQWNEVQRERRMSDPVFALQFERLRDSLLLTANASENSADGGIGNKEDILSNFGCENRSLLSARERFYYQDYAVWFAKVKAAPSLKSWSQVDRGAMSRWIVSTLAMQHVIETKDRLGVRRYLEGLRRQFFPMINAPERAGNFDLPSEQDVKELLYQNDVGYRKEGEAGKLFVRRFYALPRLLFPQYILEEGLMQGDDDKLRRVLSGERSLLNEIRAAGLADSMLPEIRATLEKYAAESNVGGDDISVLDQLLSSEGKEKGDLLDKSGAAAPSAPSAKGADSADGHFPSFDFDDKYLDDRHARNYQAPSNPYEHDLDLILRGSEPFTLEEVEDEADMFTFNETRAENLTVIRARMTAIYETKEAARRARDWKRKGKWMGEELENTQLDLIS